MLEMEMRHKHADLIHAWAENMSIPIQVRYQCRSEWDEFDPLMQKWMDHLEYRIKPEKKPDVVKLYYKANEIFKECFKGEGCEDKHDLRCTFDGETGELKSAEVIK